MRNDRRGLSPSSILHSRSRLHVFTLSSTHLRPAPAPLYTCAYDGLRDDEPPNDLPLGHGARPVAGVRGGEPGSHPPRRGRVRAGAGRIGADRVVALVSGVRPPPAATGV